MTDKQHYVSIWFFIGSLLGIYGVIILAAGIYNIFVPPEGVALKEYHAGLWWGAILLAIGVFYCVRFRPGKVAGPGEERVGSDTEKVEGGR
jgi:hypothetical protein